MPEQTQLTLEVHEGLRHTPVVQTRFDAQLELLPQLPPQEFGVAEGPGVDVGVADGLGVGDPAGVPVGVGVGEDTAKVNERVQAPGVGLGVISWARGKLEGTFGATG